MDSYNIGIVEIPSELEKELNKRVEEYDGSIPYNPSRVSRVSSNSVENYIVPDNNLSNRESMTYEKTDEILALIGGRPKSVETIGIIELPGEQDTKSMPDYFGFIDIYFLWNC